MKKIKNYIILCIALLMGVFSCVDDKSISFEKELNAIQIHSSVAESGTWLSCNVGTDFSFSVDSVRVFNGKQEPRLITQADSEEFDFEWWFAKNYDEPSDVPVLKEIIIENYDLDYFVDKDPGTYSIAFVVRDKSSGLEYYKSFTLVPTASLGSGLVITHTKDDATTIVSEIKSMAVTTDYNGGDFVYHDVSKFEINEVIKDFAYYRVGGYSSTLGGSRVVFAGESSISVTDGNYNKMSEGDDAFWLAVDNISPVNLHGGSTGAKTVLLNEDKLHTFSTGKFTGTMAVKSSDITDYSISKLYNCGYGSGVVYDDLNNRFLGLNADVAELVALSTNHLEEEEKIIDFDAVGNMEAINMCGVADEMTTLAVMRDKDDNKLYGYSFRTGEEYDYGSGTYSPTNDNHRIVEISGLEGFDGNNQMIGLGTANSTVVYYVDGNKLYAFDYQLESFQSYLVYEANPGDEIVDFENSSLYYTTIELTNISDPKGEPLSMDAAGRFLTLAINSSAGEGRVVGIPIISPNDAQNGLEYNPAYIKEWTGFGKIIKTSYTGMVY